MGTARIQPYDRHADEQAGLHTFDLPNRLDPAIEKSITVRLSFLTGFVLDGLPGWRETFALPVPERMRVFA